jgi:hypothetical protein
MQIYKQTGGHTDRNTKKETRGGRKKDTKTERKGKKENANTDG